MFFLSSVPGSSDLPATTDDLTMWEGVVRVGERLFQLCWEIPFSIPFFDFGFTFGHVIYGMMFISVSCYIFAQILKGHNEVK